MAREADIDQKERRLEEKMVSQERRLKDMMTNCMMDTAQIDVDNKVMGVNTHMEMEKWGNWA